MNAMEKAAWTELVVSVAAVATVTALLPWLGDRAAGGFGLLGLIALGGLFVRGRGGRVVVDKRDREIDRKATTIGVATAWMALFGSLIVMTLWANYSRTNTVATEFLNWLIWVQFAICYGVKGFVAVVLYRRQARAA